MPISRRVVGAAPSVTRTGPTSVVLTDQLSKPVAIPTYRNVDYSSGISFSLPTYTGGGGGGSYPSAPSSAYDAVASGGYALCKALGFSDASCQAAAGVIQGFTGGGGSSNGSSGSSGIACGPRQVYNPNTGICETIGSPGDISTQGGGPVYSGDLPPGAAPAVVVGNIKGNPIYKCPKRFVLADPAMFGNGVCFHKGAIPNKLRKWPKAPKPPITRQDAVAIRRAESARNRVKKLAGDVGFSCKKR